MPGPQLAAGWGQPGYRDRHRDAPVQTGRCPKSVPEFLRGIVSTLEEVQARPDANPEAPVSQNCDVVAVANHPRRVSLESEVQRFVEALRRQYAGRAQRRPKAFKRRVLSLIAVQLPPYPKPSGRPQQSRITKAAEMYAKQQREIAAGRRDCVSWNPIANRCIAGYRKIHSVPWRQAELRRLRDAVYRRQRRIGKKKIAGQTEKRAAAANRR